MKNIFFYIAIFSLFFNSCVNEEYFTSEYLKTSSIFEVGDEFELVNDSGETMRIRVFNKIITTDKHKYTEWPVDVKYEILTYHFILEYDSLIYDGTIYTESLKDAEYYGCFIYDFDLGTYSSFGGYMDYGNDTVTINSFEYNDVISNCHNYTTSNCSYSFVISKEYGIIKFKDYYRKNK